MELLKTRSLYYSDVNLIAQPTDIKSRSEIKTEKHRIFISPMSFLVGETFARAALKEGYSVILHRFHNNYKTQIELYKKLKNINYDLWGSFGLKSESNLLTDLYDECCSSICLDIASGYLKYAIDYLHQILKNIPFKCAMIGNIHSSSILPYYKKLFDNTNLQQLYVRCGISSGGQCFTGPATGYNRGQITEINEVREWIDNNEYKDKIILVADGGVRGGGDCVKALGTGAEGVMMASYWKNCLEAETNIIGEYEAYGGASHKQLSKMGIDNKHTEGRETKIDKNLLKPFEYYDRELWGGILSGVSYSGYESIKEFIGNGVFEIIN